MLNNKKKYLFLSQINSDFNYFVNSKMSLLVKGLCISSNANFLTAKLEISKVLQLFVV